VIAGIVRLNDGPYGRSFSIKNAASSGKFLPVGSATMKDKAPGLFPIANQCPSLRYRHRVKLSPKSYCCRRLEAAVCRSSNQAVRTHQEPRKLLLADWQEVGSSRSLRASETGLSTGRFSIQCGIIQRSFWSAKTPLSPACINGWYEYQTPRLSSVFNQVRECVISGDKTVSDQVLKGVGTGAKNVSYQVIKLCLIRC